MESVRERDWRLWSKDLYLKCSKIGPKLERYYDLQSARGGRGKVRGEGDREGGDGCKCGKMICFIGYK